MTLAFNRVIIGDCRETLCALPDETFQCCVTSPPYWCQRDYGHPSQIGLEATPDAYVEALVAVFAIVRRVLRKDGTLWLNIGDSYAAVAWGGQGKNSSQINFHRRVHASGSMPTQSKITGGLKPKDLCGIPWRLAFALQADGWYLRSDIIWAKPSPMPESVTDRPTKAHEYVFLLAKSEHYFFDADAIKERATHAGVVRDFTGDQKANRADPIRQKTLPKGRKITIGDMRNARTVWTIANPGYDGAHFATMPPKLAERCILAGSRIGTAVLDPFMGSGTVGLVAEALGRRWLGCELNADYETLIRARTAQSGLPWPEDVSPPER